MANSDARRNTRSISHPWRFSAMMSNVFCATYMATSKARHWTAFCGPCSVLLNSLRNLCARIFGKNIQTPRILTTCWGSVCQMGMGLVDEWRRGMVAKADLIHRVREVNANPSTFSEYTIEFAKLFAERWDCSQEYKLDDPSDFI